jgi:FAD/FMN-containing dehydrogenase
MVEASASIAAHHVDQLRRACAVVVTPDHESYDESRRLWNAVHDRRPAVIARPSSPAEVAVAIAFAREHELEITVRSGGHSATGFRGVDGGLLIDMSAMRGVEVDPVARTARVNGGAMLGELDVAAQAHGLVCPVGVVGHTGVAGLTLGGGVGRLQRHFGLTIDNLLAVELVTADGRHVRATESDEPELFWGLRGAGWNFGVATAFEFRLHPFGPDLHRGVLTFPAAQVHERWRQFRDYAVEAPDAVSCIFGLDRAAPDAGHADDQVGKPIVFFAWNHSGAAGDVERDTAGLRTGSAPLTTASSSAPYLEVQTAHDLAFGWGSRSFIRSINGDDVRASALDELVEHAAEVPGEATFSITALGGAIGRVAEDATAFAGRAARFDFSADSSWSDAALDDANAEWCRRAMAIVEPDRALGGYPNGNSDAGPEESRRLYGDAKIERLAALKRAWDPENVFHVNPNVAPAPPTR